MKIIRLSTFLDFGGVEKRLTNIASVDDENEWVFCAINKGGQAEKEIEAKGKQVYCLHLAYKIPSFGTIFKLYQFLKKHQPEVLHTSGAEANFHGILAGKLAGVPKIIGEEIGVPNQGSASRFIFTQIYKWADKIVGNSLPVLNYLEIHNNVPKNKLELIPNPIILKELPSKNRTDSTFTILSVSRLDMVKNITAVINVVARLKKEGFDVKFNIVGSGPEELNLQHEVKNLELNDVVHFLGYISNPYPLLVNSDVYILNSFTEGFSNSLMEAMYSGTPVISSKSGAAEEIIEHGENGWLVEVADEKDLFQKLKIVVKLDSEIRKEVGLQGKYLIENRYSLANHIQKLISIYKS